MTTDMGWVSTNKDWETVLGREQTGTKAEAAGWICSLICRYAYIYMNLYLLRRITECLLDALATSLHA